MRILLLAIVTISLAVPAWATSCSAIVPPNQTGTLTVKALDPRGEELSGVGVELYQNGRRINVPLDKVPYGSYQMRVDVGGFLVAEQAILIDEPYNYLRVEPRIGEICRTERPTLAGNVAGQRPPDLWIKAVPLRGNGWTVESKVESKGGFSLRGIEIGEYVFLLTSGSKVMHQVVHFVDGKPLQIALPSPLNLQ